MNEVKSKDYQEGYSDGFDAGIIQGEINMQNTIENRCKELGIDYTLIFTCNSAD